MLLVVHEYKKNTEGERKGKIVTWNLKMKEIFYNLHVLYYIITVKRNYDSVIHGSLWVNSPKTFAMSLTVYTNNQLKFLIA